MDWMVEDEWFDSSNGYKYFCKPSARRWSPTSHRRNGHRGRLRRNGRTVSLTSHLHIVPKLRMSGLYLDSPHTFMVFTVTILNFSAYFYSVDSEHRNPASCLVQPSWNVMAHGDAREGKSRGNWRMEWVASTLTLPRNMVYPALLPLMRTPRLPVVDW